jgi:hypothetical protein
VTFPDPPAGCSRAQIPRTQDLGSRAILRHPSSCNLLESAKFPGKIGGSASFPMPTLRECLHRGRSGRGVPVSGRPILVVFIGYGPNPLRRRRAVGKHNPTHDPPSAEDVVDFAASRDSAPEQKLGHGWPCATPQRKRQDDAGTQRWPWVLTPSRTPPRPCRAPSATSLQAASAGESRARKARPPAGQGMTRAGGSQHWDMSDRMRVPRQVGA